MSLKVEVPLHIFQIAPPALSSACHCLWAFVNFLSKSPLQHRRAALQLGKLQGPQVPEAYRATEKKHRLLNWQIKN